MARKGVTVPFIADVMRFMRGTEEMEQGLDDVADALDDVGREADSASDQAGRAFSDIRRESRETSQRISRDAKDGLGDVKQEAGQSARETAASFSGSADDISDLFQEVAANAFGGFGAAGAAAGLAAAAGIGLITSAWNKAKEAQEKTLDLADQYLSIIREAGGAIDANTRKQLEAAAIAELGGGNLLKGEQALLDLQARGIANRQTALRILTGQLLPADYARLQAAEKTVESQEKLNRRLGGSDAVRARKGAIEDAQALLELQEKGAAAVLAQSVNAAAYRQQLQDIERSGLAAPGVVRAERAIIPR